MHFAQTCREGVLPRCLAIFNVLLDLIFCSTLESLGFRFFLLCVFCVLQFIEDARTYTRSVHGHTRISRHPYTLVQARAIAQTHPLTACTHTCTHSHLHALTLARTHTLIHSHSYTFTPARTHIRVHSH